MATITIDGTVCEFEGKKTILQVALENNVPIPYYCYHPGLSVVGVCRICLAEVAQPNPRNDNKVEKIPKLLPTCQTPAADGSEVWTQSSKSQQNQKAVMEYLLINHPLDCPVCDQAGECHLQDYSYDYGRGVSRFQEFKSKNPKKDIGPNIYLYADRCIMCSRCVRFTREVTGTAELGIMGRGHKEEIDTFPGKPLDNPLSANVADICPVGALLDKNFLFAQRVWNLKSTPGIDGITASGDNLWIDHNEGVIYRFRPRENMDVNTWWTSDEIRYSWNFVHSEDRLNSPAARQDGELRNTNWDDAIAAARDGLQAQVEADKKILGVISPMLTCEEAFVLGKTILAYESSAVLALGPVPTQGEDQTFPGGYKIYAEKAPNARGVRRVLAELGIDVIDYDEAVESLGDDSVGAVLLTGNYPSAWVTDSLVQALDGKFVVLIDTLPNALTDKADVLLPSATWTEKAGTFENANNRLQVFE